MDHLGDESINNLSKSDPYIATMIMNGREMQLELGTGSPRNVVSKELFRKIIKDFKKTSSNIKLK